MLAAILAMAAGEDSVRQGVGLLLVYSLGLGIPFIAAAVAIRPFMSAMQRFRPHLATVERIMGGLLVVTGILFLTNSMTLISGWMLELLVDQHDPEKLQTFRTRLCVKTKTLAGFRGAANQPIVRP